MQTSPVGHWVAVLFVPVVAVFVVVAEDEFVPVVDCALMVTEADPGVLPLAPKQYIVRVVDCVT